MKSDLSHNNTVLVLPSWYPSETDPTSGDFIQRHIEAIALYRNQYVIYVCKDVEGKVTSNRASFFVAEAGFESEVIYYKPTKTGISIIDKYLSDKKYKQLYKRAIRNYIQRFGKPALVHVHVAQKAGRLALWMKRKWRIPYIVSEHWTAYLPEADLTIKHFPYWFRRFNKKIILNASAVTVVSNHLGNAIKKHYPSLNAFTVIPNVVNEKRIPFPPKTRAAIPVLIHASTMNYQKNVEDILDALAMVKSTHPTFLFRLFGPSHQKIHAKIRDLGLRDQVRLEGNVPQAQLFEAMQESTALIVYSRFETFGCIIIEANAMGIPAIVSDIPVFHELIRENVNGIFVQGEHPALLAENLNKLLDHAFHFDATAIKTSTTNYSYEKVGSDFEKIYQRIV